MWDDDNDEELRRALEESARLYEEVELPRLSQRVPSPTSINDNGLPGPSTSHVPKDTFKKPYSPGPRKPEVGENERELYDGPEAEGFDLKAGRIWEYPTNDKFPVRTYQRTCVETALFHNTLVSLPTGLGKTFIAAVVMYNFYMWYPKGKIIFMAPTKPLVAQQIENCINIMGIPESHTAEMTGATQSKLRAVTWKEKRVFFLTPQVVQNDLSANICPALSVKCVVIDEAHRALGDHAYAQVIRLLNSYDAKYRVLALSATPGSDLEAVQKVLTNLMISRIEVRTEDSADITKYTHERNLELMVVDVGPTINRIRVKFVGIAAGYAQRLQQRKLLFGSIGTMPRFTVLKEWENFRREGANSVGREEQNKINTDFATVHMFVHGVELLNTYGLRLLLNHLKAAIEKKDAVANRLAVDEDIKALMNEIEGVLNPIELDDEANDGITKKRHIYGHPKLDRLQEIVVAHFESFQKKGEATRAIVFCEYREGVVEICEMLKNFEPLVKPVAFMGQSVGKSTKGISQKQQLEIMEKFKKGLYNTLVSTSVGEEGLDIGEVDLIICFDAKNSPIRQVQRMGRTGRKRNGRIIMLVTRGKEEQKYNQGIFKKKNVRAVLLNRENLANHLLDESPRMLPTGVQPVYTEREILEPVVKPKSGQQDLRKMFMKRGSGNSGGASKPLPSGRTICGKVPSLSEDEFNELKISWDSQICFNKIPDRSELWVKAPDEIGCLELPSSNVDYATYVEYMRFRQRTHLVGNSTDSNMLSDLLMWADERRDNDHSSLGGGFSQVTSSQIWPTKSKKRGRPAVNGAKDSNQPKKRGRPKKDTNLDSPLKVQAKDKTEVEDSRTTPQPVPRCKPMFIEDEDDDDNLPVSPEPLPKQLALKTPSPLLPPLNPEPMEHPKESPVTDFEVICVDSDNDDMNTSFGCTQLSPQTGRHDLYKLLAKTLQDLPMDEEDDCTFCNDIFLCSSFNNIVLESKKKKEDKMWKNVNQSLEQVLKFVPHLSKEVLAKQTTSDANSQRFVSLMPNPEIFAEDMFSGMLCGGVGDLSVSPFKPVVPSKKDSSPRKNYNVLKRKFSSPAKAKHNYTETIHSENTVINECKLTQQKESDLKIEIEDQYEEMDFDFLGLSKLEDLFDQEENDKSGKAPTLNLNEGIKNCTTNSKLSCIEENLYQDVPVTKDTNATMSLKQEDPVEIHTPPKTKHTVSEQVSPILCSQQSIKSRPPLRLRKQPSRSELLNISTPTGEEMKKGEKESTAYAKVTSSSPPSVNKNNTLDVNFDMFDDSLFSLSGEGNENLSGERTNNVDSGKVNEALKEAIRQKAFEAKAKKHEVTFTQELRNMCETSVAGLTQIMQLYDSKVKTPVKTPEFETERADSSCSLEKGRQSCSPLNDTDDEMNAGKIEEIDVLSRSEEDLFADCDDEIFGNDHSSLPVATNKLPKSTDSDKNCVLSTECENPKASGTCDKDCNTSDQEESEVTQISDRSMSPIFKPSQNVRRPSKLTLKKKATDIPILENVGHKEIKTIPEDDKTKRNILAQKQPDSFQVDFSMFGDEFNNSWLCSQEESHVKCDANESNKSYMEAGLKTVTVNVLRTAEKDQESEKHDSNNLLVSRESTPENEIGDIESRHIVQESIWKDNCDRTPENEIFEVKNSELNKMPRNTTPENELDEAFATFDASRESKQNQFDLASASTPKVSKANKFLRKKPLNKANVQQTISSRFSLNKKWQPKSNSSGWISAKTTFVESEHLSEEVSTKDNVLNLSDFCDDSLLGDLDIEENRSENYNSKQDEPKVKAQDTQSNLDTQGKKKKLTLAKRKLSNTPLEVAKNSVPSFAAKHTNNKKDSDVILVISSDDEDIQHHKKGKKCALNVTSSSEESFRITKASPTSEVSRNIKKRNREALQSSSSSESVIGKGAKMLRTDDLGRNGENNHLNLSDFCDVSLLNEFLDEDETNRLGKICKEKERRQSSDSEDFVQKTKQRPQRQKKKKCSKKGNGFIVREAQESDDGNGGSSDSDSSSLDELDSSFINDSQPDASESVVDIHDKYLQSIKSPAVGRFKIPRNLPNVSMDVYSQYPDAEELNETYADDSFCVDDEPTQYEPEMSLLEIAEARLKAERREKRKLKKAMKSGNQPKNKNNHLESEDSAEELSGKRKRLKRIKIMEETVIEDKQVTAPEHSSGIAPNVENRGNESLHELVDDLAMLLDDDLDFSAIPDVPHMPNNPNSTNEAGLSTFKPNFKFVKKTSVMSGGANLKALQTLTHGAKVMEVPPARTKHTGGTEMTSSSSCTLDVYNKPAPSVSTAVASNPPARIRVIASSRQLTSSTDMIRVLRVNYNVDITPRGGLEADFILSWRFGVNRIFASDLKDRKKLEEVAKKLRGSFMKPHIIIENDRVKSLATVGYKKKSKNAKANAPLQTSDQTSNTLSPWNSAASCANAALLRQAGFFLLFSQNYDETAGFLAKLARKEICAGHGIPALAANLSEEAENRLSFFTSLPGVNFAFAIKLLGKYPTLAEFLERCSSVRDISVTLEVDVNIARKIHNLLCEVHVSP